LSSTQAGGESSFLELVEYFVHAFALILEFADFIPRVLPKQHLPTKIRQQFVECFRSSRNLHPRVLPVRLEKVRQIEDRTRVTTIEQRNDMNTRLQSLHKDIVQVVIQNDSSSLEINRHHGYPIVTEYEKKAVSESVID
jgi:hypothetical protein